VLKSSKVKVTSPHKAMAQHVPQLLKIERMVIFHSLPFSNFVVIDEHRPLILNLLQEGLHIFAAYTVKLQCT